jgi:hypothetical protein
MDRAHMALLDQARESRVRAELYRALAKNVVNRQSLAALEKCIAELEDRAACLERWASECEPAA